MPCCCDTPVDHCEKSAQHPPLFFHDGQVVLIIRHCPLPRAFFHLVISNTAPYLALPICSLRTDALGHVWPTSVCRPWQCPAISRSVAPFLVGDEQRDRMSLVRVGSWQAVRSIGANAAPRGTTPRTAGSCGCATPTATGARRDAPGPPMESLGADLARRLQRRTARVFVSRHKSYAFSLTRRDAYLMILIMYFRRISIT
jgi:hypothetical protein